MNERSSSSRLPHARRATRPTEARIQREATELFYERGFHATSMRDLASALEIQPSALYASFPSKNQLLAELVRVGHEVHLASLRAGLLAGGSDPMEQLRAVVRANAQMHMAYPHLAVVVNDELHALPPELGEPGFALRRQAVALLTDIVARGIALGRFQVPHPAVTVAAIGAMSLRLPYWFQASDYLTPEDVAEAQVELAARMVGVVQ